MVEPIFIVYRWLFGLRILACISFPCTLDIDLAIFVFQSLYCFLGVIMLVVWY